MTHSQSFYRQRSTAVWSSATQSDHCGQTAPGSGVVLKGNLWPKSKGLFCSYADGVAFLVWSCVWKVVINAVHKGNPEGGGWAYGWVAVALLEILCAIVMVEFLQHHFVRQAAKHADPKGSGGGYETILFVWVHLQFYAKLATTENWREDFCNWFCLCYCLHFLCFVYVSKEDYCRCHVVSVRQSERCHGINECRDPWTWCRIQPPSHLPWRNRKSAPLLHVRSNEFFWGRATTTGILFRVNHF